MVPDSCTHGTPFPQTRWERHEDNIQNKGRKPTKTESVRALKTIRPRRPERRRGNPPGHAVKRKLKNSGIHPRSMENIRNRRIDKKKRIV
jgi:hypothetical protein